MKYRIRLQLMKQFDGKISWEDISSTTLYETSNRPKAEREYKTLLAFFKAIISTMKEVLSDVALKAVDKTFEDYRNTQ